MRTAWLKRRPGDVAITLTCVGTSDAAYSKPPLIRATAIEDGLRGIVLPHHCAQALSTDGGAELVRGV